MQILVNRTEKKLLLKPCDEIEITGYRWGRTKNGKRYPSPRTGELFVLTLCELMDWNPDYRYKVLGKVVKAKGQAVIAFDLTSSECFPKVVNRDGKKVGSLSLPSNGVVNSARPTPRASGRLKSKLSIIILSSR